MEKIAKYKILEKLGKGGMGIVYKAFDPLMEREVAIKVLPEQFFDEEEIKQRFYREARSAGKLSHENITIVYDLGETDGKPYIVMEYLTGSDLKQIIKSKQNLSVEQKLDYAIQISKGLAYSHSKKIVHRDIKPENIRILDDGKVKIMDFGIAKPSMSTMTRTGTQMGTPHYMSPEQIKGAEIDHRTDIFSFGVLLYELFTSKRPFEGDDPTTVWYKIVHEEIEPIADSAVDNIPGLKSIIQKCLQKNVKDRYPQASALMLDLENLKSSLKSAHEKSEVREQGQIETEPQTIVIPKKKSADLSSTGLSKKNITIGAAAIVLVLVAIYGIFIAGSKPEVGYVALNVMPWGYITKVADGNGNIVEGFENLDNSILTPCKLPLPAGDYKIAVANPVLKDSLVLDISLKKGEIKELNRKFAVFDYSPFLTNFETE